MKITDFLKLKKPDYNNIADIEVLNENFETLDQNAKNININLNGKEPKILIKKTGFNLEKTDVTENNSEKLFTTRGALNLFTSITKLINDLLSVVNNHIIKVVSTREDGHMSKGDKLKLDGIDAESNKYTLPLATEIVRGGVKIFNRLNSDATDGAISASMGKQLENNKFNKRTSLGTNNFDLNSLITDGHYYGLKWINSPKNAIAVVDVKVYFPDWVVQSFTIINDESETWKRCRIAGNRWTIWHKVALNDGPWSGEVANDISTVTKHIRWNNYGKNHIIFEASSGKSPAGTNINNKDSQVSWSLTHPTLMGWNSAITYGLRVDTCRYADYAPVPVGFILMTDDNRLNPAILFSGTTWGRIAENRNIRGASASEGVGSIGGSDTVGIKHSNLPNVNLLGQEHSHTRGSMNITGNAGPVNHHNGAAMPDGAFYVYGGAYDADSSASGGGRNSCYFEAARTWVGSTSGASNRTVPLGGS